MSQTFVRKFSCVERIIGTLQEPTDAASLAFFRILFGCILLFAQIRFLAKGWVEQLYIKPEFHFKYFGFSWVHTLPGQWMYLPWVVMIICLIGIILGKWYRLSISVFFVLFCYTELLDLTNYLNHYYFITLVLFLMLFLPMHAAFSVDARRNGGVASVPRWMLLCFRLQVGLVYFFAGFAKIKSDWLLDAQPLKIWLATTSNLPVFGALLALPITAWVFSWIGMLFDLSVPFLLLNRRSRGFAYFLIVVFHLLTMWLFYIGMFPLIMMAAALVFFPPRWHRSVLQRLLKPTLVAADSSRSLYIPKLMFWVFALFFVWQILMPLRHFLYSGNVLWTEQGYRYAWHVMLMEKDGFAEFWVEDKTTHMRYIEYPKKHLTALQEKMMSTQPDMILQYAHYLAGIYEQKLGHPVAVYADVYVSLNGRPGRQFINPDVNLAAIEDTFAGKDWILPENPQQY
ncbi:MAG: HTTM domain-containing protein [Bacteroidetes bacterium]|nr:HTTM domain-containing protein [Bacteroidota bacterium]